MKKIIIPILAFCSFFLVGCLETIHEVTINENGSGTYSTINDMSAVIGLARQMGGAAEMEKQESIDSSFSLRDAADSVQNLTPAEKELIGSGTMHVKMNLKEDKFIINPSFPFSKISQIPEIGKLSGKVMGEAMKKQMGEQMQGAPAGMEDQMPEQSSVDDYYKFDFTEGELTRKVDKSKYAGVESDEFLKQMRQATSMGLTVKTTYIFNLPRPVQKAEGKNVKVSADKKKVTISAELDEFFEDASSLEFKIKY